jgi:predicted transcriptional regulator of viral defense system
MSVAAAVPHEAPQERVEVLSRLPQTFTLTQALSSGLSKYALYSLRDEGLLEVLGRGLYRRADSEPADLGLIAIAVKAPRATLCLSTALARHELTDAIPAAPDVALPRGTRPPSVDSPVAWHQFDRATFDVGRDSSPVDATTSIGLYSAERSIVDAFRLRGTEGPELGYEALRRWLRRPDNHPQQLVAMAGNWPRVLPAVRHALEVLL